MELSNQESQQIEEALEEIGLNSSYIRDEYCSRGESKYCFGIKFDDSSAVQEFFVQLAILNGDLAQALVSCCRHYGMGKGKITYFPGYQLQ